MNKDIAEILKNAGVQLNETSDEVLYKFSESELMEDANQPYENMDEINKWMNAYEDAYREYHEADYYDDNYSWREAQSRASKRIEEAKSMLKELTGKTYYQLLDELGSIESDEDTEPTYKVGDKFEKNGKLFTVVKVKKDIDKTRNRTYITNIYELKQDNGSLVDFITDDTVKMMNYKPVK